MNIIGKWINAFGEHDIPQAVLQRAEELTPGCTSREPTLESYNRYQESEGIKHIHQWGAQKDLTDEMLYRSKTEKQA